MENGLCRGCGRGNGGLDLGGAQGLERSVWVWDAFRVEGRWIGCWGALKLNKKSRETLGFLAPVVGWMVVLFTEKGETGRTGEAGLGEESSCGLDVYEGRLRCGTGLWRSPGLTLFFLRALSS